MSFKHYTRADGDVRWIDTTRLQLDWNRSPRTNAPVGHLLVAALLPWLACFGITVVARQHRVRGQGKR